MLPPAEVLLPGFSVKRVLLVPGTIFFHFQTPGGVLLVLPGAVVATLALSAGKDLSLIHIYAIPQGR